MVDIDRNILEEFAAACRRAASYSLMKCSSGNMSRRLDGDKMLVSASRSWMSDLTVEQICCCNIADASIVSGPRPSVETRFHAGILHNRSDINVVLHFQGIAATTLACSSGKVDYNIVPEIPCYIGEIGQVGYIPPGSIELASEVIDQCKKFDLVQLANHGQVVVGRDYNDAIQRAVFFEMACELILRCGDNAAFLPESAIEALKAAARA